MQHSTTTNPELLLIKTFAFYLYSKDWYVGASIPQLLNSKLGFFEDHYLDTYNFNPDGSLERHYFAMAGYKWKVNYDYVVEPSVLLKSVTPAPIVVDIGLKVTYQNKLWMGTNYRTNGDIGLLLGLIFWIKLLYDNLEEEQLVDFLSHCQKKFDI